MDGPTLTLFLVQIGLILAIPLCMAKLLARLALSPLVVELLCGVLLGPSVFGMLAPDLFARIFPALGRATQAREAVTELGLLLFVFMAGLELQPKRLRLLGLPIFWSSFLGILVPLVMGVGSVLVWPQFWRNKAHSNVPLLALFIGTVLSISALPVIARILLDLNLLKTELGAIVMSAAMLDDLAGWGLFAIILSSFGGAGHSGRNWWASLVTVVLVFGLILNLSNQRIQRAVGWLNLSKETLQLKLTFLVLVTAAIFSEVVGTHATLGAFLAGVALGRIPDPGCAQAGARKLLPSHGRHFCDTVFRIYRTEGQFRCQLRPAAGRFRLIGGLRRQNRRRFPGRQAGRKEAARGADGGLGDERPRRHGNCSDYCRPGVPVDRSADLRGTDRHGAGYFRAKRGRHQAFARPYPDTGQPRPGNIGSIAVAVRYGTSRNTVP
jgi:predicted Kef-type K+ transport protein